MKSSAFLRSLELAKLAAQVGIKELRSGNLKSRMEQASLIANSLSKLKGAAMKAGQLLSLDLDSYFPPEAIEILSQLQSEAAAHPYKEMLNILQQELGPELLLKVSKISHTPIGVASIGQVHTAIYKKNQIVLKIQYPHVSDSIDSDLKILKTLALSFCQITGRKMNLDLLFAEFKTILQQEVNYEQEAAYQKKYYQNIVKLNARGTFTYVVPEIIDELSTNKVLAMNFQSGVSLRAWINSNPPPEKKLAIASGVLDLYFHEFFEWGLVQTDPNWGNFLVQDSGDQLKLVLLDFGATRKYTKKFVNQYIELLHLAAQKKSEQLKLHAVEMGLIDKRESSQAFAALEEMLLTAIRPFFRENFDQEGFDFSDLNHASASQNAAKALAQELIYSPPPYMLIFLHRKLAGVYSILKALQIKLDISSYWQKMSDYVLIDQ